ncbi:hypothetical protein AVEN_95558-1 [Araneus ventricosus]|uniref:RNase H type-1 domain-containing protein n=1 Tax=Araneus ventricosus TaxID=182803 RepID=A0A4Y2S4J1_ARAVE|nr:hypothetical protein AVEN_95558-1 [Araneus ventricosus]
MGPKSMVVLGSLCAFSREKFNIKLYVKYWNTVFQAELVALGEAVDWDVGNKKKINIYTDSRSSIEALKSYGSRSKFVISIKDKLYFAEGLVGLAWLKAHVGIPGNEPYWLVLRVRVWISHSLTPLLNLHFKRNY